MVEEAVSLTDVCWVEISRFESLEAMLGVYTKSLTMKAVLDRHVLPPPSFASPESVLNFVAIHYYHCHVPRLKTVPPHIIRRLQRINLSN